MAILSVDLACRSWSDLGVVVLSRQGTQIVCEIVDWPARDAPALEELAARLDGLCRERSIRVLMLDGPQAWKSAHNGLQHARVSERQLNTPAKTGLPGMVKPITYRRFAEYCIDLYDAMARHGWRRLATRERPSDLGPRVLVESFPYAAWKSLGLKPLPAKHKAKLIDLAEAWAALQSVFPLIANRPPNHDQLQAIVGGLPGLAIEDKSGLEPARVESKLQLVPSSRHPGAALDDPRGCGSSSNQLPRLGSKIVGQPPRREAGQWREGFIALPVRPWARDPAQWFGPSIADGRSTNEN